MRTPKNRETKINKIYSHTCMQCHSKSGFIVYKNILIHASNAIPNQGLQSNNSLNKPFEFIIRIKPILTIL